MKIFLNRYMQNRSFTHGKLQIEGFDDVFDTLELAIPSDKMGYIKHCLPPGEYPLHTELALLSLQNGTVRCPWASLCKVKWFPKAGLYTNFSDYSLLSGRIFIGNGSPDEWSVTQDDMVTARIVSAMQTIYDADKEEFTDSVKLIITESPDLIIHDYDRLMFERKQELAKEQQERIESQNYFNNLLNS